MGYPIFTYSFFIYYFNKAGGIVPKNYLKIFFDGYAQVPENSKRDVENDDYKTIALHFPYDKKKFELKKGTFQIRKFYLKFFSK